MMLAEDKKTERSEAMEEIMIARMVAIWNRLDTAMKLAVACIALYILLYAVVDISMEVGRIIALCLM